MGIFGKKPMGYYTNQAAPREALGLGMTVDPQMQAPQEVRGGGFFGAGGTGRNIAGYLGDALLRMGGGQAMYAPQMQHRQDQADDDARWEKRFKMQQDAKGGMDPTNAAKMAVEAGLIPGTPEFQKFVRRYAFKPTIMQVGNADGGVNFDEYDPSGGDDDAPQVGETATNPQTGERMVYTASGWAPQ